MMALMVLPETSTLTRVLRLTTSRLNGVVTLTLQVDPGCDSFTFMREYFLLQEYPGFMIHQHRKKTRSHHCSSGSRPDNQRERGPAHHTREKSGIQTGEMDAPVAIPGMLIDVGGKCNESGDRISTWEMGTIIPEHERSDRHEDTTT